MPIKITPFLWFDDQAEEAMRFYTSIFINKDADRAKNVMNAMRQMDKLDIKRLKQASERSPTTKSS